LFTKFNKKYKSIFLDPHAQKFVVDEKVNVILSPSYYWVKKLTLPVKYVRDAKKLLPSIFEDVLPEGNYNYSVYKKGDFFFAFAYDDKVILDALEEKGVAFSNVANVFFAQSELGFIEGAIKVNETQSIYFKDDILVLLPCCWIEESGSLDLGAINPSNHSITLAQFGHIIDNKSLYKIGTILSMLIVLVLIELLITNNKINELTSLKDNLFSKAKLQSTMLQNQAALKKYNKIHTKQMQLREYFSTILSFKLQAGESLNQIGLKNKNLSVEFSSLSEATIQKITNRLTNKKIKFKTSKKENTWHLEMVI
jgi:hypothetical protein